MNITIIIIKHHNYHYYHHHIIDILLIIIIIIIIIVIIMIATSRQARSCPAAPVSPQSTIFIAAKGSAASCELGGCPGPGQLGGSLPPVFRGARYIPGRDRSGLAHSFSETNALRKSRGTCEAAHRDSWIFMFIIIIIIMLMFIIIIIIIIIIINIIY